MGPGGGPNQDLFFVLMNNAVSSTAGLTTYWSVQHRHPDGHPWVDVAHFLTREDADAAVAKALGSDPDEALRVEHVRRS